MSNVELFLDGLIILLTLFQIGSQAIIRQRLDRLESKSKQGRL